MSSFFLLRPSIIFSYIIDTKKVRYGRNLWHYQVNDLSLILSLFFLSTWASCPLLCTWFVLFSLFICCVLHLKIEESWNDPSSKSINQNGGGQKDTLLLSLTKQINKTRKEKKIILYLILTNLIKYYYV